MVSHSSAHPVPAPRGRVVLCCADENLLELAPVVEGLGKLSLSVELVSGVDLDSTLVNAAVKRLGPDNLWVLCQSEALDAFQITRLQQNLGESGVDASRVMTREVDSTSPSQLIEMISHAEPGHDRAAAAAVDATTSITGTSPAAGTGPSPTIGALLGSDLPPAMPEDDLDEPPRNLMPVYLGVGGAAVLAVIVAVVMFNRGPKDDPEARGAEVAAAASAPEADEPASDPDPPTDPRLADTDGDADEAADTDGPVDEVVDTDGDADEAADTDGDAALLTDEAMLGDGAVLEGGTDGADEAVPDELPETTSSEEQALIDAAIRKREIRSLDILLVHPQRSRRKSYESARTWCEEKEIEGIGNWRLPTIGEIRTISDARLVPRDYYWTHTAADTFGDQLLVWNGKRKRITPKKSRWSGGRAVCVRTRDGAPAISEDKRDVKKTDD